MCWQQYATLHAKQTLWLQQHPTKYLQDRKQREQLLSSSNSKQESLANPPGSSLVQSFKATHVQHRHSDNTQSAVQPTAYLSFASSDVGCSRLINALDLADATVTAQTQAALPAGKSATCSLAGCNKRLPATSKRQYSSSVDRNINSNAESGVHSSGQSIKLSAGKVKQRSRQPASSAEQAVSGPKLVDGYREWTGAEVAHSDSDSIWEAAAAEAVARELVAVGLPGIALVSGAGPCEAAEILTVAAAAAAGTAPHQAVAPANSHGHPASPPGTPAEHNTCQTNQQATAIGHTSTGSMSIAVDSSISSSQARPRKAQDRNNRMQNTAGRPSSHSRGGQGGLPGWQRKLLELEAACRTAEQLMVHGGSLAERKTALELAGNRSLGHERL